ncbi:hypothetical protein BSKO_03869 [Bryopsis sp. KO-2023]|nr:hypothetical protein BSKO_03869 [Bryopsis sp. KO-2023]
MSGLDRDATCEGRCTTCLYRSRSPSPARAVTGISAPLYKSKEPQEQYAAGCQPFMARALGFDLSVAEAVDCCDNGTKWSERHNQAKLRNELSGLRKDFKELSRHHDRAENQVWDLRDKLKGIKSDASSKDKQLDLARRTVDRLTAEKSRLEANVANDKAYIRKLEAKISTLKSSVELQSRCGFFKNKVRELEEDLRASEARLRASEEVAFHKTEEVRNLQRALDIKAQELSIDAGVDVHSRLLFAVAKGEDECVRLAMQLSDLRGTLRRMEEQLQQSESSAAGLKTENETTGERALHLQHQLSAVTDTCTQYEKAAADVRDEICRLHKQVEGLCVERDDLDRKLGREISERESLEKLLEQTRRRAKLDMEDIRAEMSVAMEKASTKMAEHKSSSDQREGELTDRCSRLARQVVELKELLDKTRASGEDSLQDEKRRSRKLEDDLDRYREHEKLLREEAGNLHVQVDRLTETNHDLQDKLVDQQTVTREERIRVDNLNSEMAALKTSLDVVKGDKASGESTLRNKIECLLRELTVAIQERDDMRMKLQEMSTQLKTCCSNHKLMENDNKKLQDTNDNLTRSKALLQQTMLDQIATVRSQLEEAKVRNLRLERNTRPPARFVTEEDEDPLPRRAVETKYLDSRKNAEDMDWRKDGSCKRWASETPVARGAMTPGVTPVRRTPPSSNERATDSTGGSTAVKEWREEVNRGTRGMVDFDTPVERRDQPVPQLEDLAYSDLF